MKRAVIYGAGGLGREIKELLNDINSVSPQWNVLGFIDDGVRPGTMIDELSVLGDVHYFDGERGSLSVIFGLADCCIKASLYSRLSTSGKIVFPVIIHPSSYVSPTSQLEEGTVVGRFCSVSIDTHLGKCVFLNTRCDVGHDAKLGNFCSLMPSVNISGNVTVGEQTLIGVQSAVIQGVSIGSRVTVGMGSRVMADVPGDCTVMGYPARIIARHKTEDRQ